MADENDIARDIAGLLVLVRKWHRAGAINDEHRSYLKDAILACEPDLIIAFRRFVNYSDKEALVDALLRAIPNADIVDETYEEADEQYAAPYVEEDLKVEDADASPEDDIYEKGYIADLQALAFSSVDDVDALTRCIQRVPLYAMDLDELWDVFEQEAYYEGMDADAFQKCINPLVEHSSYPTYLQSLFSSLFDLLDRDNAGVIDFGELIGALSLLCRASVGQKLQFAWDIMDFDGDGMWTQEELFRYMYACSAVLTAAIRVPHSTLSADQLREEVWMRAKAIFKVADVEAKNTLSFTDFTMWSNNPTFVINNLVGDLWDVEDE